MTATKKFAEGEPNQIRRKLLLGGAAALVAGCDGPAPASNGSPGYVNTARTPAGSPKGRNTFDTLSRFRLRDQQGEVVNMKALASQLKDRNTTMTFSFSTCEQFCPTTDIYLAQLEKHDQKLTHIIIAVRPLDDGGFTPRNPEGRQQYRDAFLAKIRERGVKNDVKILYPESSDIVPAIANAFGQIANLEKTDNHSPVIILSEPGGKIRGDKFGGERETENLADWNAYLDRAKGANGR